jgi:hypothetical protein
MAKFTLRPLCLNKKSSDIRWLEGGLVTRVGVYKTDRRKFNYFTGNEVPGSVYLLTELRSRTGGKTV